VSNRVLIVEDDHATETLLAAVMLHESIECVSAGDGRAALDRLESEDFSAILLDLLLPNMNGFEVLRHLRSTSPQVLDRVIVITAASETTFKGCDELRLVRCVLRKPLDLDELISQVRGCFGNTHPAGTEAPRLHVAKRVPRDT
jgi:DNA-binding response OmpR family regulator